MTNLNPADLRLISHTTSEGVTTRELVLGDVTAVLWAPEHAAPGTPVVLLGHGGEQHRHHPAMSGRARLLTDVGFRPLALDAGGHGPRPRTPYDELAVPEIGDAPAGYWGIALGTAIGVPLAAAEPLIQAAVFGLFWPSTLIEAARRITVPIEFDLQWDDEHIPREGGLALFDTFASKEKSLHVNAGKHMEMPRFEAASAVRFLERHLRG